MRSASDLGARPPWPDGRRARTDAARRLGHASELADGTEKSGDARRRGIDGCSVTFGVLGGAMIVAGGLVAAVNSAAPFAHGSWLAAYLVLVGGVSQLLLGVGRLALPNPTSHLPLRCAEAMLWNAGNLTVAVGVLGGLTALVTVGSVVLLVGLGCFAAGARITTDDARGRVIAYHAVIVGLAASVIVGSALADAIPGVG